MSDESVLEVCVRDLTPEHVGMQIEVAGRWEDLHGFSHQGITGYKNSSLHIGLLRVLPEKLFLDAELNQTVKLRKHPTQPAVTSMSKKKFRTTKLGERISRKLVRFAREAKYILSSVAEVAGPPLVATAVVVVLFIPLFLWGQADPTVPQALGVPAALVLAAVWWAVFLPLSDWLS